MCVEKPFYLWWIALYQSDRIDVDVTLVNYTIVSSRITIFIVCFSGYFFSWVVSFVVTLFLLLHRNCSDLSFWDIGDYCFFFLARGGYLILIIVIVSFMIVGVYLIFLLVFLNTFINEAIDNLPHFPSQTCWQSNVMEDRTKLIVIKNIKNK